MLRVQATNNCGASFSNIIRIDSAIYNRTNQFQDTLAVLEGLDEQEVMFRIMVKITKTDTSRAYFDLDNWIIESTLVGNRNLEDLSGVAVFPNPGKHEVTLQANSTIVYAKVADLAGRTLQSHSFSNGNKQQKLTIVSMPKGVYLIELQTKKGLFKKKFMKK